MIEEENDILQYIELCCFLSAYFKLGNLTKSRGWHHSVVEIVDNCTPRCVRTIILEIDKLLADPQLQGPALLTWVTRYADGLHCRSSHEARERLTRLRADLEATLDQKYTNTTTAQLQAA